jgi:hypothetical protein
LRWQRSVVSVVSVVVACNWYKFTNTTLIYMVASVLSVLRIIVSVVTRSIEGFRFTAAYFFYKNSKIDETH